MSTHNTFLSNWNKVEGKDVAEFLTQFQHYESPRRMVITANIIYYQGRGRLNTGMEIKMEGVLHLKLLDKNTNLDNVTWGEMHSILWSEP